MKKLILIAILFLSGPSLFAQHHSKKDFPGWDAIKNQKIAFLTEQLSLTPEEAQNFWPVYNMLESERAKIWHEKKDLEDAFHKDSTNMTDAQFRQMAEKYADIHLREGQMMKEYNEKLLKVLPANKVVTLYFAERKFMGYLMKEYRRKHDKD
ncbi:hypothetical protein PbJCM13498_24050 [Prolixibacter bellariivorans]|uniref:Sensor of ECF-type sigma factor n=1 Tax=Prolixibacter bellariivorans TaxID=314319 RepID=A0A5M4B057_9BACT|nr:hypothetical protein [Prolixibacter bellariivorans]GET33542.1 hypothetical protein PbJCM13498_24050 [Prolixibacter bellariivorans]